MGQSQTCRSQYEEGFRLVTRGVDVTVHVCGRSMGTDTSEEDAVDAQLAGRHEKKRSLVFPTVAGGALMVDGSRDEGKRRRR